MLGDASGDEIIRVELQEATLSGRPLGSTLIARPEENWVARFVEVRPDALRARRDEIADLAATSIGWRSGSKR